MLFFEPLSVDVVIPSATVTAQFATRPLVVFAWIATVPADTPVMIPAPSTVAIFVSPDIHSILSVVFWGATAGNKRNVSPTARLYVLLLSFSEVDFIDLRVALFAIPFVLAYS